MSSRHFHSLRQRYYFPPESQEFHSLVIKALIIALPTFQLHLGDEAPTPPSPSRLLPPPLTPRNPPLKSPTNFSFYFNPRPPPKTTKNQRTTIESTRWFNRSSLPKTPFDPNRSIYGPLYATVHFIGETPLWEKISLFGARNVKGQKFIIDSTKEESSVSFANYAEILGGNLYLKAVGIATDIGPVGKQSTFSSRSLPSPLFENPFQNIISSFLFQGDNSVTLLPTPYDYEAKVTGASIVFFQKFPINLTIEGTGTVRVLYADDNLRIFVSPGDTEVTKGGGDWERGGLIVVQVRVDLVFGDRVDCL